MIREIRLLRSFLTVGGWTFASRIGGLIRDVMLAAFLGAGPVAEAFQIAFSLPNMFRRFFAEGAFNMAFVPMFSKKLEGDDDPRAFAQSALSVLFAVLVLLSVLAHVFMPWMILGLASGFAQDARFDMAVDMGRIAFPYILFISLTALFSGVLNAFGRFAAAAAAPVLLNVVFISAMILAAGMGYDVGQTLIWAVPLAGFAQLGLVWWAAKQAGYGLIPRLPRFSPEIRHLMMIAIPAGLSTGVVQVNLIVGRQVASYFEGAVAWLAYADRLYQLPLGVVGIAIGIVLLPDLSRKLRANDEMGAVDAVNRATEFALALSLPAAIALMVIPGALVSVLFERGAFERADTLATAEATLIYGLGLPAMMLQKVLAPVYFAREDTRRPFYFALAGMVMNLVIAIGLLPLVGFAAAAWGTTLASWLNAGLLYAVARRYYPEAIRLDARNRRNLPRLLVAALAMGGVLFPLQMLLLPWLETSGLRYVALAVLVGVGGASYFAFGYALRAIRIAEWKSMMKRGA